MAGLRIRGWIVLPSPQRFDDAVAIVGLDDVTCIDAESTRIAEAVIDPLTGDLERVPFALTVDDGALAASSSYVLAAEIRTSRKDTLSPGDFLSTAAHPWSPASDAKAEIAVKRI